MAEGGDASRAGGGGILVAHRAALGCAVRVAPAIAASRAACWRRSLARFSASRSFSDYTSCTGASGDFFHHFPGSDGRMSNPGCGVGRLQSREACGHPSRNPASVGTRER